MRIFALILTLLFLFGCNRPNPNPELEDEIYRDLQSQVQSVKGELEAEKKKLEGFKKELDAVVPQTGAIKYAQKRYFESEARVQKLAQELKYFELRVADRLRYTQISYAKAFKEGKPWPPPEEIEAYKKYNEVVRVQKGWDTKKRVKEYETANGIISNEAKPAEKEKKEVEKGPPQEN